MLLHRSSIAALQQHRRYTIGTHYANTYHQVHRKFDAKVVKILLADLSDSSYK
jgi:hypothetical protein